MTNDSIADRQVATDLGEEASTGPATWLTPEEAADLLKVSAEHIRALIRAGRLKAVNLAIGKKRPLYRIRATAIDRMVAARGQLDTKRPPRPHFKRLPPVVDHFPHLR